MTMGMTLILRQSLGMEFRFGASVLPRVTKRLDSGKYDDVIEALKEADQDEETEWRDLTDWFLCQVIPMQKAKCLAFYENDNEKRLCQIYDRHQCRRIDAFLVAQLDLLKAAGELGDIKGLTGDET